MAFRGNAAHIRNSQMAIVQVPVSKGKSGTLECETDMIPEAHFQYALIIGIKSIIARGMTKIDKDDKDAIMEQAQKNLEALYSGKTRMVGAGRPSKVHDAGMVEGSRLAKLDVMDGLMSAC